MNVTAGDIRISYPDLGFAFNPIRLFVENYPPGERLILTVGNIVIEREVYSNTSGMSFDLSAITKSLFDRHEFHKVKEYDTTLFKTLFFELENANENVIHSGSIPVIWGALQIGEIFTQNKTLIWFKDFPFTLPLFIEEEILLQASSDGGTYQDVDLFEKGKYNINLSYLNAKNKIQFRIVKEDYYKIFDYTFDYTFGPQKVLLPQDLGITVNIVDCPNDGVYLRWINKYGEYNYYLFQSSIENTTVHKSDIAFDGVYYSTFLTNNYHHGTGQSIGNDSEESIKLFASLVDSNTFNMLIGLVESPVVDMFLGYSDNGSQNWISITVADGTFAKSTDSLQDFELYLIPNKKQIQTL